ncbi:hypothetical protein OFN50_41045, partial [Escherichia coli]|nr:hypothetical protein [Escherichia coli]
MKNQCLAGLIVCFSLLCPLLADYDLENVGNWEIEKAGRHTAPYQIEVSGDWIGDSKFSKDSIEGDHIRYSY